MNIEKLISNRNELFSEMAAKGYIDNFGWEIKWIERTQNRSNFLSYAELFRARLASGRSKVPLKSREYHLRSMYAILQRYEEDGVFPDFRKRSASFGKSSYNQLNSTYKKLVDDYKSYAIQAEYAETTIKKRLTKCSCFLLFLQKVGFSSFENVTEATVLSFFSDDGSLKLSRSYRVDIYAVLMANRSTYPPHIEEIITYLPNIKKRRKNIQYINREESAAVQQALNNTENCISKRDRAIGMLLYYTGVRAGDVASLTFEDVDWKDEKIRKQQGKNGYTITLPFNVLVGNAIFSYITEERPQSESPYIFLWSKPPYYPIGADCIWPIAAKIYDSANIRMSRGDRRGSHLFRHHLATQLANAGIAQPVISEILGHEAPESLDYYLSADIEHLRACSLSIESFPASEEVFQV